MYANTIETLFERIQNGYEFRLGDYFTKGWEIFRQNAGIFIGYSLIYIGISLAGNIIPIIGGLALLVISPALSIGPYIVANRIDRNEPYEFKTFFQGFDKLGQLFVVYLLQILMIFAAMLPGFILLISSFGQAFFDNLSLSSGSGAGLMTGVVLITIPAIYLGISYVLALPLVWFFDLQPWQALETSRKLVGKQWFMWLAFFIVQGLLAFAGIIALFIGLLFAIPIIICANYAAMADITRLNERTSELDDIDISRHFGKMD
ncbi:MAG: hypothetical protein ACK4NS_00255 [Saprospiraceae bacterium]